jgi:hypothetical protein
MATRGWGGSVAVALGVAAATAAAALGLGYGLGILVWPTATDAAGETSWLASLAWTTWIAATATVLGAVVGDRLAGGAVGYAPPRRSTMDKTGLYRGTSGAMATTAWRLVIALAAAIGGLLTVPLVAVPARAAHRPDTYAPQLIAGGYAIIGVAVGLAVAILALSARSVAINVIATAGWLWALAIASVIHGVATGQGLSTAQLAIWHFGGSHFINGTISLPGAALMMGAALVIGGVAAWPAVRRDDNRVGVAISGAIGPLLCAVAYFLAAPKLTGAAPDDHLSAYLIAPYAVIAGLAGSVILSAVAANRAQRAALQPETAGAEPVSGYGDHPPASTEAAEQPSEEPADQVTESPVSPALSTMDELDADAYAPARAYASESALSDKDGPSTKKPLWPSEVDMGGDTQPRRGKNRDR